MSLAFEIFLWVTITTKSNSPVWGKTHLPRLHSPVRFHSVSVATACVSPEICNKTSENWLSLKRNGERNGHPWITTTSPPPERAQKNRRVEWAEMSGAGVEKAETKHENELFYGRAKRQANLVKMFEDHDKRQSSNFSCQKTYTGVSEPVGVEAVGVELAGGRVGRFGGASRATAAMIASTSCFGTLGTRVWTWSRADKMCAKKKGRIYHLMTDSGRSLVGGAKKVGILTNKYA